MNLCITAKHYRINKTLWDEVEWHVQKIQNRLSYMNPNLGLIKLIIKRNKRRNYFDGSVSLSVPKKHLYTYFQGTQADEAIRDAFKHIFREISKYKGKHFANDSQYYRHESVRENYGFQTQPY